MITNNFTCFGLLASQTSIQIATNLIMFFFTFAVAYSITSKDHSLINLWGYIVLVVPLILYSVGIQTRYVKILNLFTHYIFIIMLFITSYVIFIFKNVFDNNGITMKTSTTIEMVVYFFAALVLILYYLAAKGFAIGMVKSITEENQYRMSEEKKSSEEKGSSN